MLRPFARINWSAFGGTSSFACTGRSNRWSATSGVDTYGARRYLLDTVKGADLGEQEGKLVLDFNFSYNPSCAYDPRWVGPARTAGEPAGDSRRRRQASIA